MAKPIYEAKILRIFNVSQKLKVLTVLELTNGLYQAPLLDNHHRNKEDSMIHTGGRPGRPLFLFPLTSVSSSSLPASE